MGGGGGGDKKEGEVDLDTVNMAIGGRRVGIWRDGNG